MDYTDIFRKKETSVLKRIKADVERAAKQREKGVELTSVAEDREYLFDLIEECQIALVAVVSQSWRDKDQEAWVEAARLCSDTLAKLK